MSVFAELQTASFRGINFLVPTENKSGGKKIAEHNYPGNNRRFIEELGVRKPDHSITAIVHGNDAIQRRVRLEQALEQDGQGLLIHPTLGQIVVTAISYSSSSSDTDLGKFTFRIEFREGETNVTLTPTVANNQLVSSLKGDVEGFLDAAFINRFTDTRFIDNISASNVQFNALMDIFEGNLSLIEQPIGDQLSKFNIELSNQRNQSALTVRDAKTFADGLRSLYNSFENISSDIPSFFQSSINFTNFGLERVAKPLITEKRIQEEINLSVVDDHTRVSGLIGGYESAVFTDFQTDVELLDAQSTLESKYIDIVERADQDSIALDPDVRDSINELRVRSRDVFEEKAQNIWRVVGINPRETGLAGAAYRFYGDLERLTALSDLNQNINFSVFDDQIRGLS